ncbi:MAG: hypothetical protein PHT54_01390 [Candidatus Nanoarchaeia archaeon]|nr:hypothetical protein [Candidatus Nanoarchaeia archaeon]
MWNLNYEDPKKFHISLGLGLMLAAGILIFGNNWAYYTEISDILEKDYSFLYELEEGEEETTPNFSIQAKSVSFRLETLQKVIDARMDFMYTLFIMGAISFLGGYVFWIFPYLNDFFKRIFNKKK